MPLYLPVALSQTGLIVVYIYIYLEMVTRDDVLKGL